MEQDKNHKPKCSIEACQRISRTQKPGLCDMHKQRKAKGRIPLTEPEITRRPPSEVVLRDAMNRKECTGCRQWKDEARFSKTEYTADGLRSLCGVCSSQRVRLRNKGFSQHDYDILLLAQGGRCAICRVHDSEFNGTMNIDHDHSCCPGKKACGKCVRGLLCPSCNMGIGALGDSVDRLEGAIAYLSTKGTVN